MNTLTLALSTLCIVSLIFFLAHEALCDRKKIKIEEIKLMQAGDKSQSYLRYVVLPSPENVYMDAAEHGWYDSVDRNNPHIDFFPAQIALIHSELSEALEDYRNNGLAFKDEKSCIHKRHAGSASEELADAVLRIFSLVGFLGITDFDRIIYEKYQMNKVRVYRHEGKVV